MSSDEIYPRAVQDGSAVHSEMHGPGQVISSDFSKASGILVTSVRYHNGLPFSGSEGPSARSGKGAALFDQIKISVAEEERGELLSQRGELLSHSSITSVLQEGCNCTIQCTVRAVMRAGLTHTIVHQLRSATLQHFRSAGARTRFHAGLLRSSRTENSSRHPAELRHGPRYAGQRATKQHYAIGNIDVFAATYARAHGLPDRGLRAAADFDLEEQAPVSINKRARGCAGALLKHPEDARRELHT